MGMQKPSGGCADEVLQGVEWPAIDEDTCLAAADDHMQNAAKLLHKSLPAVQGIQNYSGTEMSGQAADALCEKMGLHVTGIAADGEKHQNLAGWLSTLAGYVFAAKTMMASAVSEHEEVHDAPLPPQMAAAAALQDMKDASLKQAQAAAQAAAQEYSENVNSVKMAVDLFDVPAPPGGAPKLPTGGESDTTRIADNLPGNAPISPLPGAGAATPGPAAGVPSTPGAGGDAPTLPPGTTGAAVGPASPFAPGGSALGNSAGAGAGAGGTGLPSAGADSAGLPSAGAEPGLGAGSPMGGMPMGMPMGGMPMQPPQMPQMPTQTPGNDIAKTVGDTVGKLAGGQQGTPMSEATLDKLLAAQQGPGAGADGDQAMPADGHHDKDGGFLDDDAKADKATGTHTTLSPPKPYDAANPSLGTPGAGGSGPPSPASAAVTPAPPVVHAPMTELSADENAPVAPQQTHGHTATDVHAAGAQPNGQNNGQGNGSGVFGSGQNQQQPVPGQPGQQQPVLGPYSPGPMAPPMPMAAGMGGMGAAAAAMPAAAAGSVAPILGVVPGANNSGGGGRHRIDDAPPAWAADTPTPREAALAPEHATAHKHLASIVGAHTYRRGMPWVATALAVGVFTFHESGLPIPRTRYVLATTDGVSLVPAGVKLPAGVELLGDLFGDRLGAPGAFLSDWSGNAHPAQKLVEFAKHYPRLAGRLEYLVSNDAAAKAAGLAVYGKITETIQSSAATKTMLADGKATPPLVARADAGTLKVRPDQVADILDDLDRGWGFGEVTANDVRDAGTRLWAARWGTSVRSERPRNWAAAFVAYCYAEARIALDVGLFADAAYAATQAADASFIGADRRIAVP